MGKYVHLIKNTVFTKTFIEKITSEFSDVENFFCVIRNKDFSDLSGSNVEMIDIKKDNFLLIYMKLIEFDKIFIHDCSNMHIGTMFFLSLLPQKKKKQYWVLWGHDLYCYQNEKKCLKEKINEYVRRKFIRNLRGIIFWVKGEYELATKWYKTKAKYFSGGYMSDFSLAEKIHNMPNNEKKDDIVRIQVGNSANPRNRHIDALEKLHKINLENVEIYCPLSYPGNTEYINEVIKVGKKLFGEKFIPMKDFIPRDKYIEHLNSIDIGVFNTDRQMGLGNLTLLIALGKKVYINDYTTPWNYYIDEGAKIFSFNKLDVANDVTAEFLKLLSEDDKENNYRVMKNKRQAFYPAWKAIFDD